MTAPRPHGKVAPAETVEVSLTVNGTPTRVAVAARVTLADVLRDHLGLTGTHLGCEHGVCGMCTVLVDGQAARACLLFACQLDGSEVVTVEGLGRPDDLHPLQESFGRHHGLQCGFCTPGFLMSALDLLAHRPDVAPDALPEALSGVLCRCTGYRNIVDAVADVADEYPDGVPGPGNCAPRTLAGRAGSGAAAAAGKAPEPEDAQAPEAAAPPVEEIRLPQGEPSIRVDHTSDLAASTGDVGRVIADVPLLARCLPGADLNENLGNGWYRGRAKVALGPVRMSFASVAHVVEHDREHIRVLARGADPGGGSAQADIRMRVQPSGEEARVHAEADIFLTGRIAQFGRALAGDFSRRMFAEFATAVEEVANGAQRSEAVAPAGGFRLLAATVAERFRRMTRRGRE